jgi:uncharacterized membrane protein YcaP (DUF421 family)
MVLDDISIMVENGLIRLDKLEEGVISREQLMARLRQEGVTNLGAVRRVYHEANGSFSLLRYDEPRPGLSILPTADTAFREEQKKVPGHFACASCAHVAESKQAPTTACPRCQEQEWQPAVVS